MNKLNVNEAEHLWVEKYRPTLIEDLIIPQETKKQVQQIIDSGKIPNLLFYGSAGVGKTTLARIIAAQSNADWIIINGSNERGIDTIREKVVSFASTTSLSGNTHKVVIIDEADRLSPVAMDATKAEIERFSKSCAFIFTANHPNRIIDPLRSRLVGVDFNANKKDEEQMQALFFARICDILDNEKVKYDERVLVELIFRFYPDMRRVIGELQQYARSSNEINEGLLIQIQGANINSLVDALKNRKFKDVTQWSADNASNDTTMIYEELYKSLRKEVKNESIPEMILILEEYQRYDSIVPSKELHLSALGVSLMTSLEFK